jgi:hypothetical protein
VTVAKGSAAASSAESVKVAVRLTAAGVKDLKRYLPMRIKSVTAFTATGVKQIVKSTTFTLSGSKSAHVDASHTAASDPSGEPAARGVTLRLMKTLFGGARGVSRGRTQIPRSDFTRAR